MWACRKLYKRISRFFKESDTSLIFKLKAAIPFYSGAIVSGQWCNWSRRAALTSKIKDSTDGNTAEIEKGAQLLEETGSSVIGVALRNQTVNLVDTSQGRHVVDLNGYVKCTDIDSKSIQETELLVLLSSNKNASLPLANFKNFISKFNFSKSETGPDGCVSFSTQDDWELQASSPMRIGLYFCKEKLTAIVHSRPMKSSFLKDELVLRENLLIHFTNNATSEEIALFKVWHLESLKTSD